MEKILGKMLFQAGYKAGKESLKSVNKELLEALKKAKELLSHYQPVGWKTYRLMETLIAKAEAEDVCIELIKLLRGDKLMDAGITVAKLVDAIEDTIYTRLGPLDPHDLELVMREITRELANRWLNKPEVS